MPRPDGTTDPSADEFLLIRTFFAPLTAGAPGAFALTDDAAVLSWPAAAGLVVTCDTLVEGVHFRPADPPASVGWKALAVNLSDLAAMGAEPSGYLLSASLPADWAVARLHAWLAAFCDGLRSLQQKSGISLLGGDTVATPGPLSLTITALGRADPARVLRRAGARVGDALFVSGTIGDAALGLRVLQGELSDLPGCVGDALIARYQRPQPRTTLGPRLVGIASACVDVSDGLVADVAHLCEASGLCARIFAADVPLSAAARAVATEARLPVILCGGDDYELAFSADPASTAAVAALGEALGVPLTRIGVLDAPEAGAASGEVRVYAGDGQRLETGSGGFRHFR